MSLNSLINILNLDVVGGVYGQPSLHPETRLSAQWLSLAVAQLCTYVCAGGTTSIVCHELPEKALLSFYCCWLVVIEYSVVLGCNY